MNSVRFLAYKSVYSNCRHRQKLNDFFAPIIRENKASLKRALNVLPVGEQYLNRLRMYTNTIEELKSDQELIDIINQKSSNTPPRQRIEQPNNKVTDLNSNISQIENTIIHHNIENSQPEDYELLMNWIEAQEEIPQVLVEDQPLVGKAQPKQQQPIEMDRDIFVSQQSQESFQTSINLHTKTNNLTTLAGSNLRIYLSDFFTEDLYQIDYEQNKIINLQNKILNPSGTFFMTLLSKTIQLAGLKVRLIDFPKNQLVYSLAASMDTNQAKKLLVLCNITQLLERAYFLKINEHLCCEIKQQMPIGYIDLILGDPCLPNEESNKYIYSRVKKYVKPGRKSVILITSRHYQAVLAALLNEAHEEHKETDYEFDREFIKRAVMLDLMFEGQGENIVEEIVRKNIAIDINVVVRYLEKYSPRLTLDYLIRNLNEGDQMYLNELFENPIENCKIESLLFQKQVPIAFVQDERKKQYLRRIHAL